MAQCNYIIFYEKQEYLCWEKAIPGTPRCKRHRYIPDMMGYVRNCKWYPYCSNTIVTGTSCLKHSCPVCIPDGYGPLCYTHKIGCDKDASKVISII